MFKIGDVVTFSGDLVWYWNKTITGHIVKLSLDHEKKTIYQVRSGMDVYYLYEREMKKK